MAKTISELKAEAKLLDPMVRVGKNGLTPTVVAEIQKHLKKRKLIKIKLLKSIIDQMSRKELREYLLEHTQGELISMTGNTLCLYKEK